MATKTKTGAIPPRADTEPTSARQILELDAAKARDDLDLCSIAAERATGAYNALKATGDDYARAREAAQHAVGARADAVTALRDAQQALDAWDATHQTT